MTNQKPEGQYIRRYRYRATASVSRPLIRRGEANQSDEHENVQLPGRGRGPVKQPVATKRKVTTPHEAERRERYRQPQAAQEVATRRKVTIPHEAVQPLSWAERRERYRQPQPERPTRQRLVKRTLSQTGHPAPAGRRLASKPLPRSRASSPTPVRRRQQRSKGFWGKLLGFLTLLVVLIGGVSIALTSPTFHVSQLTISGTHNPELISYIRGMGIQGQDIFLLNQSALTARLETLPLVASASLAVQLPSSVIVNIQERVPVLLWQSGQSTLGVDQNGVVIAPLRELGDTNNLTTVVDKRSDVQVHPGTHFKAEDIAFAEQLIQQLPGIQGVAPFTLQYVDWITVDGQKVPANEGGDGSYVVSSASGWVAYLGNARNSNSLTTRLQELQQILNIARQQSLNLATIDLRFGLRPTYTLKS
jgi:hypothetical protein